MTAGGGQHAAVLYDSAEDLRARVVPYLHEALDRGEAVLVAVPAGTEQVLRSALGGDGARVEWGGIGYAHLGAMFAACERFLAGRRAAGVPVRMLTENGSADPDRAGSYLRFEAMANEVLGAYGQEWACLFDRRRYAERQQRQVEQTHPFLLGPSGRPRSNGAYLPPREFLARHPETPSPVPGAVEFDLALDRTDELAGLRRHLLAWAGRDGGGVHGLLAAVGEVVTNALEHGSPPCRVRAWTASGTVHVRVDDAGTGTVPVDAGYRWPGSLATGGGLWLARRLADVVQVRSGPGGTAVELRFPAQDLVAPSRASGR